MSLCPTSFHLVEKEENTNFMAWTYPTISEEEKTLIQKTCFSDGLELAGLYYYLRQQKNWIYIKQFVANFKREAIVIISRSYQPHLFKALCDIFVKKYIDGSNGVELVKVYLKIFISRGVWTIENSPDSFVKLNDFQCPTDLKALLKHLGIESILLYNALLLKKRTLVYHSDVEILQKNLESITTLAAHRTPADILEPLIHDIADLKKKTSLFLIGTVNKKLLNQQDLFDIIINLQSQTISVTSRAKGYFLMSPLHKEIAHFMMQLAESQASETTVIEEISKKTDSIFKYLKMFVVTKDGKNKISREIVESKTKNKNLAKFILNLALSENIKLSD